MKALPVFMVKKLIKLIGIWINLKHIQDPISHRRFYQITTSVNVGLRYYSLSRLYQLLQSGSNPSGKNTSGGLKTIIGKIAFS